MSKNRLVSVLVLVLLFTLVPFGLALAEGPGESRAQMPDAFVGNGCVGSSLGPGQSISGRINGGSIQSHNAYVLYMGINGQDVPGFCTDMTANVSTGECGYVKDGPAAAKIDWLLLHYPASGTLSNQEAAARQSAIWYYSDNFVPTASTFVVTRTREITGAVPASPNVVPVVTFNPATLTVDVATFDINVTLTATREGNPMVGQTLSLTTSRGTLNKTSVTTDNNGQGTFKISNTTGNPLTATVTAVLTYAQTTQYTKSTRQTLIYSDSATGQTQGIYKWTQSPTAVQLTRLGASGSDMALPVAAVTGILALFGSTGFLIRRKRIVR